MHYHVVTFINGCLNDSDSGPIDSEELAIACITERVSADADWGAEHEWTETPVANDNQVKRYVRGTYIMAAERCVEDDCVEEDDDPQCVCGVYRSEHALCGCSEGFQSAESWESEREAIHARAWAESYDDGMYDDETDDQYYQSQVMYYCKHGVYIGSPGGADYMCGRCESE